ncbi:ATP-dependent DNA ligase [Cohnella abietis]|uniref:SPBc2 prophage-derived DNA ligase-like protein LigB n=1 Tax=Cohnella abietis TaxID=2507935 RepID=A0A3T1D934_9BACL|nr:RNA ligase family protein [Cohnella abietis]BBI34612.1 SPBc2 prophage-derived DNA ligase-like protein LigB [Cohnella abietis]
MLLPPTQLDEREKPFDDERYIFEPKINGHRLTLSMEGGAVRLYTRHNHDVTRQYPELYNVPIEDNSDFVLDGEVACINPESGSIDFELVMERLTLKKPMQIREAITLLPVHFFVFDILRYKGEDLRGWPLVERKKLLREVLCANNYISPLMSVDNTGVSLFDAIQGKELEGIVAKKKVSKYFDQPEDNWIKIINYNYAVVQIVGYRKNQFGWLLEYRGKNVGILDVAVPSAHKNAFFGVSKVLLTGEDRNFVYVKPQINARVKFRSWTRTGLLRKPVFVEFVV